MVKTSMQGAGDAQNKLATEVFNLRGFWYFFTRFYPSFKPQSLDLLEPTQRCPYCLTGAHAPWQIRNHSDISILIGYNLDWVRES
jgi:hypothetical protein